MRLHIVRHADPDYANDTITPLGHDEARALAPRLAALRPRRLFSSPMGRARATAQHAADAAGLDVEVLPWTAELHSPRLELLDGAREPVWNLEGERIRESYDPAIGFSWQAIPALADPVIAELCRVVADDSDAFLADLGYRRAGGWYEVAADAEVGDVVVVCHAGFTLTWLAHLLCVPPPLIWSGLFLAPTSVTTVLLERRSDGRAVPRALAIGDTGHLAVAGLTPSARGLLDLTHGEGASR